MSVAPLPDLSFSVTEKKACLEAVTEVQIVYCITDAQGGVVGWSWREMRIVGWREV